jgi:uncharacterized protein YozE (UPF0346 family)
MLEKVELVDIGFFAHKNRSRLTRVACLDRWAGVATRSYSAGMSDISFGRSSDDFDKLARYLQTQAKLTGGLPTGSAYFWRPWERVNIG